jgi:hypothetical protein
MSLAPKDPLLAVAKGVLWFLMGVMAVATVACLLGIPLTHIFQGQIAAEIASKGTEFDVTPALWPLSGLLLLAAGLMAMLFRLFQLLKRIIDTVGEGDPFVPVNATRLTHMAWLTVGTQLITIPMAGVVIWLLRITEPIRDKGETVVMDGGIDMNGLLMALVLFILARVFREGARMRADLEGTV